MKNKKPRKHQVSRRFVNIDELLVTSVAFRYDSRRRQKDEESDLREHKAEEVIGGARTSFASFKAGESPS